MDLLVKKSKWTVEAQNTMYKPNLPFRVLVSRAIAVAVTIFLIIKGCEYACWMWDLMTATIKSQPIVLTEEVHAKIKGKDFRLPRGLVLYPLNKLECSSEVYDEREYKIYVSTECLKFRKLTDSEIRGATNLLYRVEVECESK